MPRELYQGSRCYSSRKPVQYQTGALLFTYSCLNIAPILHSSFGASHASFQKQLSDTKALSHKPGCANPLPRHTPAGEDHARKDIT